MSIPSPKALLCVLCTLVALVYWPGLSGAFVFDDFANIVDNAGLRVEWTSDRTQWINAALSSASRDLPRPLAMLSFAANHASTGMDPWWMKFTNLVIHLVNTLLVFGLARTLLRAQAAIGGSQGSASLVAIWVAAAWALNPINFLAVLVIVQRMESLCHTFVFAGLWIYLTGRIGLIESGKGWLRMSMGIVLGTGLGVFVKESAALLPLYALLVEWALFRGRTQQRERDPRLALFFGVVAALPAAVAMSRLLPRALHPDAYSARDFNLIERLLTESRVLVDYVQWTVLPNLSQLSLYHDDYPVSRGLWSPAATTVSIVLLLCSVALAFRIRNRRPLIALGIAWFLGAHLLTATLWPLELVFEHRNYFASLGLCLILADLLLRQSSSTRRVGWALGVALLCLYGGTTALRAGEWSDQLRFSMAEAQRNPTSPRATYDLARNLVILSDFRVDSPYYAPAQQALEKAMHAPGASPLAESAAIFFAARSGAQIQQRWWQDLQRKLRTRPTARAEIGAIASLVDCSTQGYCRLPPADMVDVFLASLESGSHPEILNLYGNYAWSVLDDAALAQTLFEDAVKFTPDEVTYRAALARVLIARGRGEEAIPHIEYIGRQSRYGRHGELVRELMRQARPDPASSGASVDGPRDALLPGDG